MTMMQQPANAGRTQGPYSTRCDNFFSNSTAPAQPWLGKAEFPTARSALRPDAQRRDCCLSRMEYHENIASGGRLATGRAIVSRGGSAAQAGTQSAERHRARRQCTDCARTGRAADPGHGLKTLPTTQPHAPGGPVRERQDLQRSDGQRK